MENKLLNVRLRFISKHLKQVDLDIFQLAEFISDEVINHYGQHNYSNFKNIINKKLK